MSRFKRQTRIVTKSGNSYVTNLHPAQVEYFLTADFRHTSGEPMLNTLYVDGTGHVKSVVLRRDTIAEAQSLISDEKMKNMAREAEKMENKVKRIRLAADGQVYRR